SAEGKPHSGASIVVVPPDLLTRKSKQAWTDATGYFRVEGLVPGRHLVRVYPKGEEGEGEREEMRREASAYAEVREGEVTRVEFETSPRGCLLRGRVLRGGDPVEGAELFLRPARLPSRARKLRIVDRLRDKTGPDGSYSIDGVPAGVATLYVYVPGEPPGGSAWTSQAFRIEVPDATEQVFDADLPSGEICGRVLHAGDGKPLPGIFVLALPFVPDSQRESSASSAGGTSGPDGRYRIRGLPGGSWRLRPQFQGPIGEGHSLLAGLVEDEKGPIEVPEGGKATADVTLSTGGTAVVTVRDPAGRPVPRATVAVFPAGAQPYDPRGEFRARSARADDSGLARVRGVVPGLCVARVLFAPDWAFADSEPRPVRAGEETPFTVEVKAGTRVRFRLVDEDGEAIDLGVVLARDREGRAVQTHVQNAEAIVPGEEDVASLVLVPGEYSIEASSWMFEKKATAIRVGETSPQDVLIRLDRAERPR
ncbi:MAG TPA: carboxypeptidase-like regulatory domain-containing protein, partial [Planctomycetota bacterium]|nr:carboxypeptidase-like regulatory domain-containing protein [Planctomycetota bacterium]